MVWGMVPLRPGQLVLSTRGRDEGRAYLVMRVDPSGFVWLTDGRYRRQANPKKKNRRHLWTFRQVAHELGRCWEMGERVPDADVRETLERLAPAAWEAGRVEMGEMAGPKEAG